jgi:hypothetical protein
MPSSASRSTGRASASRYYRSLYQFGIVGHDLDK